MIPGGFAPRTTGVVLANVDPNTGNVSLTSDETSMERPPPEQRQDVAPEQSNVIPIRGSAAPIAAMSFGGAPISEVPLAETFFNAPAMNMFSLEQPTPIGEAPTYDAPPPLGAVASAPAPEPEASLSGGTPVAVAAPRMKATDVAAANKAATVSVTGSVVAAETTSSKRWIWVVVAVLAGGALIYYLARRKKRRSRGR